jgi:hypothetical protein
VHFIDEQQTAQPVVIKAPPRLLHFGAQVFDPSQYGIEAAEMGSRARGDDPSQGGFTHTRWPVEDQIANAISRNRSPQESSGPKDLFLTLEIVDAAGPHPIGEGRQALAQLLAAMAEQIAHTVCNPALII